MASQRGRHGRAAFSAFLVAGAVLTTGLGSVGHAGQPELWAVSIPNLNFRPGERAVGFQINLKAAAVYAVEPVPVGWTVVIENNASWVTRIMGKAEVGAASLHPSDFQNLLTVKKNEFANLKFGLDGEIAVTRDFIHTTLIKLENGDFEIRDRSAR